MIKRGYRFEAPEQESVSSCPQHGITPEHFLIGVRASPLSTTCGIQEKGWLLLTQLPAKYTAASLLQSGPQHLAPTSNLSKRLGGTWH